MLDAILARLRAQPSRTGSLIITLYGDAIAPRGGSLWLGSLLALFRALGVGDGVVRTAVSRLAAEGWLDRTRIGRNSFYRLSARGDRETEAATPRIYGSPAPQWDGRLRLALLEAGPERETAREVLLAAGYGVAAPTLLVAPDSHDASPGAGGALTLYAEADAATLARVAQRAWPLDDLADRYRAFLDVFPEGGVLDDPQEAMLARLLLVHQWRRLVLRDPHLAAALLPPDWPGGVARTRAARLYDALYAASERWLDIYGRGQEGALPAAMDARRRFAG